LNPEHALEHGILDSLVERAEGRVEHDEPWSSLGRVLLEELERVVEGEWVGHLVEQDLVRVVAAGHR